MNNILTIMNKYKIWIALTIALIGIIFYAMPLLGYYSGLLAYFSVGQAGTNYYTVGNSWDALTYTVGLLPKNNIADFPLVAIIATIAPAIIMLGVIVFLFYLTWKNYNQGKPVQSMALAMITLLLIGVMVFIGGPLLIESFDNILWGNW